MSSIADLIMSNKGIDDRAELCEICGEMKDQGSLEPVYYPEERKGGLAWVCSECMEILGGCHGKST